MTWDDRRLTGVLIIGSYTHSLPHVEASGTGISVLEIDPSTGIIRPRQMVGGVRNPTYLALSKNGRRLYSVEEMPAADEAGLAIFHKRDVDGSWELAGRASAFGDAPCHVSLDAEESWLFVSNYGTGNLVAYPLGDDGLPAGDAIDIRRSGSGPNPDRQEGPHVHQAVISPDEQIVLVCDAGTDEIVGYPISSRHLENVPEIVSRAKPGSLPRHLAFSVDGRLVFVLHEISCTITTYVYRPEGMIAVAEAFTLPSTFSGNSAAAAIRVHPNGRFLYASNRGHDSIAVFAIDTDSGSLEPRGWFATGGKIPRDFAINPDGTLLVAANQDSNTLNVFSIDGTTGGLKELGEPFSIGTPVCVLFG